MIYRFNLVFYFSLFGFVAQAQNDCGTKELGVFDAIFGIDSLAAFGRGTLFIANKKIIYSCEQCSIICMDSKGVKRWTKDLRDLNCKVITFRRFDSKQHGWPKRYDIIVQLADKKIYGLRSKSGKMKYIKS